MGILQHSLVLNPQFALGKVETVGLFPRGYVSIVAGSPAVGKTWFMLDVCRAVADGRIGMGNPTEKYKQGRALVFAGETGFRMLCERMTQLGGLENLENVRVISSYEMARLDIDVMLNTAIGRKNIAGAVAEWKPDIVFFDTVISFMGGGKDESSQADMTDIIRGLSLIASQSNSAFVLLHHFRKKSSQMVVTGTDFRSLDEVIGSSAFTRLASLVVGLEKRQEVRYVHCIKSWWKEFAPFTFVIKEVGGTVELEKTYGYASDGVRSLGGLCEQIIRWVLTEWAEDYFSVIDIVNSVDANRSTVGTAIQLGVSRGIFFYAGKRSYTKYYTLKQSLEGSIKTEAEN